MSSWGSAITLALTAVLVAGALSVAACGPGPSTGTAAPAAVDSPEVAAQALFEEWAQHTQTPYRNVRYVVLDNDGTSATVRIVAELRPAAEDPWLEHTGETQCRNVGGRWSCGSGQIAYLHLQFKTATQWAALTPPPTATCTPTAAPTPLPRFVPILGTIVSDRAYVRDQPNGLLIGVLNLGDEVLVYGGRMDEAGTWWYLIRLDEIHNPATRTDGPLAQGYYGWIWSGRVGGVAGPQIGATVEALETMRAAVATPTPIGNAMQLETPTPQR